jgi:hypothetical protein
MLNIKTILLNHSIFVYDEDRVTWRHIVENCCAGLGRRGGVWASMVVIGCDGSSRLW